MRAFSILALCLLAAGANAIDFRGLRDCLQTELSNRVNSIVGEVNSRLDKITGEGSDARDQARSHFNEKTDAFKKALNEPLEQARADYDKCLENRNAIVCRLAMAKDLVLKVIPIASQKTIDLVSAINEIVSEFRDNRAAGMEDLRTKGTSFGKEMIGALRACFSRD